MYFKIFHETDNIKFLLDGRCDQTTHKLSLWRFKHFLFIGRFQLYALSNACDFSHQLLATFNACNYCIVASTQTIYAFEVHVKFKYVPMERATFT